MGDGQSLEGVQKEPFSSIVVVGLPPQQLKAGQRGEEIHPSNNTPHHNNTHHNNHNNNNTHQDTFFTTVARWRLLRCNMEPFDMASQRK